MLAAEFTKGGPGRPSTLDINQIIAGRRTRFITFNVTGKREARQLAKTYAATPWNF